MNKDIIQGYKKFIGKYNIIKEKREKLSVKANLIAKKANKEIDKLQDEDMELKIKEDKLVNSLILNK